MEASPLARAAASVTAKALSDTPRTSGPESTSPWPADPIGKLSHADEAGFPDDEKAGVCRPLAWRLLRRQVGQEGLDQCLRAAPRALVGAAILAGAVGQQAGRPVVE